MNTRKWFLSLVVLLAVLTTSVAWAQEPGEPDVPNQPEEPAELASLDADAYSFLAIGAPYEDVSTTQDAGAVNVIYGSDGDLTAVGNQVWYEGHDGMLGTPEEHDHLGKALAVGDFDGDGNLDLAIGEPDENYNTIADAGAVRVLYGASGALAAANNETWHQNSTGIVGSTVAAYDRFGCALAVGDFDGDGYEDLAVGVKGEQVGDDDNAGVVNVIYGSASGLTAAGNQVWRQGADSIQGLAESGDQFGYSLASADFDGDGYDDLAVGVPYEDQSGDHPGDPTIEDIGGVNIIYGSSNGLAGDDNWWVSQNLAGILNDGHEDDSFGFALAVGDFDGDLYADLAVGVPYENLLGQNDGAVNVIYGSASGLTVDDDQLWNQANINDDTEENDWFGYRLTAGDFDGDGRDDLAVGVPYEDVGSIDNAGAVHVLYGHTNGLTAAGSLTLQQNNPDIHNTSEANDRFGMALAAGNFDGDPYTDLAIGAPGEDLFISFINYTDAGAVNVIYGSASGLTLDGDQFWHQNSTDIKGVCEDGDRFGDALAAYSHWETPTEPEITVSPGSLAFGNQGVDAGPTPPQTVTITNDGDGDLHITDVSLSGADAYEFDIESDSGETTLAPGSTRTIQYSFDPSSEGAKSASLSITSDDADEPTVNVVLSGNGVPGSSGWFIYLPLVSNNE